MPPAEDGFLSPRNPKIKLARALRHRKDRRKHGAFLVEGLRHVGAALEAQAPVQFLLWAPERLESAFGQRLLALARQHSVPAHAVTAAVLDSLSPREHSQGMVAVVSMRPTPLSAITPTRHPWVVGVVAPQNPGNVGTILRTMDAAGADALVLLDGGTSPYHPAAVRASMGALFWLPVAQASWQDFFAWARQGGYTLYGTSAHAPQSYDAITYTRPAVLLLGNERHGLTAAQREACHALVALPMSGHGTSLNLAVAAGVMLYAMRSSIHDKHPPATEH